MIVLRHLTNFWKDKTSTIDHQNIQSLPNSHLSIHNEWDSLLSLFINESCQASVNSLYQNNESKNN